MRNQNYNFKCTVSIVLLILGSCVSASAQTSQPPLDFDRSQLDKSQIKNITLYPTQLSSRQPSLHLSPRQSELINRNAVTHYSRALLMAANVAEVPDFEGENDLATWTSQLTAECEDLMREPIRKWLEQHRFTLREIERGRRSSLASWGILPDAHDRQDWADAPMPEHQCRNLGRILRLKAKLEIADSRFDSAVTTIGTLHKLAIDMGKSGILLGDLIGMAILDSATQVTLEFIQQPNAPSLYWALTGQPSSLFDINRSLQNELLAAIDRVPSLSILENPETRQWSLDEWRTRLFEATDPGGRQSRSKRRKASPLFESPLELMAVRAYPFAKKFLRETGVADDRIETMAVAQVIALAQSNFLHDVTNQTQRNLSLPLRNFAQNRPRAGTANLEIAQLGILESNPSILRLLSMVEEVQVAHAQKVNDFALLKTLEAIRLHLGETGALPEQLNDVVAVPVPNNLFTGKLFRYERTATGASLYKITNSNEDRYDWIVFDIQVGETK